MLTTCLRYTQLLFKPLPKQNEVFEGYDRMRQFYIMQRVVSHFERRLDDPAPLLDRTLLDIGCGLSAVSEFMVLSGADVTAIDQDEKVIEEAQSKAKVYGTDINFAHATPSDLIASEIQYDVIVCLDVMEYIDDLDKFLWTVKRLLRDDGLFVFSTISKTPAAWLMHIFLSSWILRRTPIGSRRYKNFITLEKMSEALEKQGLSLSHSQGLTFSPEDTNWQLNDKISTRYLAAAALKTSSEKPE